MSRTTSTPTVGQDAIRGLASGLLVGIPVVFTVDTWWLGDQNDPLDSLLLLGFAYLLTLAAVFWIGFRRTRRHGWEYAADALEALAIAVVALAILFWTMGQIQSPDDLPIAFGRVAVASLPVTLGVAVANHLLPRDASRFSPEPGDASDTRTHQLAGGARLTLYELAASAAGALFLSLAIVPTDDLAAISTRVPLRFVPAVIALSLAASYCVVFAAGFSGQRGRHTTAGPMQDPITETLVAYLSAVVVAFTVLRVLGRLDSDSTLLESYMKTMLLALPASIAGAAGRLAV